MPRSVAEDAGCVADGGPPILDVTGGSWTGGVLGDGVVTPGVLARGVVTGPKVTGGTVTLGTVAAGTVAAGTVAPGTVAEGMLAVGAATVGTLTEGTDTVGVEISTDGSCSPDPDAADANAIGTISALHAASAASSRRTTGRVLTRAHPKLPTDRALPLPTRPKKPADSEITPARARLQRVRRRFARPSLRSGGAHSATAPPSSARASGLRQTQPRSTQCSGPTRAFAPGRSDGRGRGRRRPARRCARTRW